jgi:predicted nucleotidyltransferase
LEQRHTGELEDWQRGTLERSNLPTLQRDALLERICKAAAALKSHFGARRVILFGSLIDAKRFNADSDVDLVAEGLDPFDRWDAWWLCEEIIHRPVDLVPLEAVEPSVRDAIERRGREL